MIIPDNKKVMDLQDFTIKNLNPKEDICTALQKLNIEENIKKKLFCDNSNLKNETNGLNDDVDQLGKKFVEISINGNETDQNLGKETRFNSPENKNLADTNSSESSDENDFQCASIKDIKNEECNKRNEKIKLLPEESEEKVKEEIFVGEVEEKKPQPEEDKEKSSDLCSRGPIQNRIYRSHEKPPLCSKSHDSGGIVVVAEDPVHRNHHTCNNIQNIPPNVHPQNIPLQNVSLSNVHSQNLAFQKMPAQNIPVQNIPIQNVPIQNVPIQNVPIQNVPIQNVPMQNVPIQNVPIQNVPMQNISVRNITMPNIPIQNIPVQNFPIQNIPVQNISAQNIPVHNIPSQNIHLQNIRVQNISVQNIHAPNIQSQNMRHCNIPLQMSSENIHHRNISPQNIYHHCTPLDNIPHQNVPAQNITQNIPLPTMSSQTKSPQSVSPQCVSPQSVSSRTMSPQSVSSHTMSPQSVSSHTMSPQSLSPEYMTPQYIPPQYVPSQNIPPQNILEQNTSSYNVSAENIVNQNIPSDISLQKVSNQSVPPEVISDYNIIADQPPQNSCSIDHQGESTPLWENDELEKIALIAENPAIRSAIKLIQEYSCDPLDTSCIYLPAQREQSGNRTEDTQTEEPQPNGTSTGHEICSDRGSIGDSDLGKLNESSEVGEMSPKSNDSSLGSPQVVNHYNHLSPSNASTSGVSSYKDSPQYEGNEHGGDWFTKDWVEKNRKYTTVITGKQPGRILCPKPPISKTNPDSAKAKLLKKLDDSQRPRAWGMVYSKPNEFFTTADKDGDTQLMILVSNKCVAQLECIHAMVERMRNIPNSLSQVNKALHSALYIACLEMNDEPLVPAYIAEALAEQNIDVAKLTYEHGKTLPEILRLKGDSHKEVLKELLSVKNSSGQYIFQSYRHDINGNV